MFNRVVITLLHCVLRNQIQMMRMLVAMAHDNKGPNMGHWQDRLSIRIEDSIRAIDETTR